MTREAVLKELQAAVKVSGSLRSAATAWGVQGSYLSEILSGVRKPIALPEKLLMPLGIVAEVKTKVTYRKIDRSKA